MSGFEAQEPIWDDASFGLDPSEVFAALDNLEQLEKEAITRPVLATLELLASPEERGLSSFVEAGYIRAQGRPLRPLTAEMLETRLEFGPASNPDDSIISKRIEELFEANEKTYDDEVADWNKKKLTTNKELDEPLRPEDRMRARIAELRELEKQKQKEEEERQTRKRLAETLYWAAEFNISLPENSVEPLANSVEALAGLWAVGSSDDKTEEKPPSAFMPIGDLSGEKRNSANEEDFLEGYPGLQQLRDVLIESTYDQIIEAAPDSGFKQEYLRNCIEHGINAVLIGSVLTPDEFRRDSDPKLLVDMNKLKRFQDAVKKFGLAEANCLSSEEALELNDGLVTELTTGSQKGYNLATTPLNVTQGYKGLKAALFHFETIVLHDKGNINPWAETKSLATLFAGTLAMCAITRVIEKQGGRIIEIPA